MNEEAIQYLAYIKQIDKEMEGMLKDRETVRQKLIEIVPGIDNIVKEIIVIPKEDINVYEIGGQDGKTK